MHTTLRWAAFGLFAGGSAVAAPTGWVTTPQHAPAPTHAAGLRDVPIVVDAAALAAAAAELRIGLPDREARILQLQREQRGSDRYTLRGALDGDPQHPATLTWQAGRLAGMISAPEGVYEILPDRGAGHTLALLDPTVFPPCAGAVAAPAAPAPLPGAAAGTPDPPDTVDVLIVYSPQVLAAAGGAAQVEATAQGAIDAANTAFANSDMVTRFVLRDVRAVARDEGTSNDLSWVATDAQVATWRDELGADMVALLVETSISGCGVGYVMRSPGPGFAASAFQVTRRSCAVGNLTYAHEHGHNMGMEHDPANGTTPTNASYPWSFGHFVDGSYRTVMSYSTECASGCTRRPYFSNPAVSYLGAPTGIAEERDNHRTGNLVADIVANFRTRPNLFADGFED